MMYQLMQAPPDRARQLIVLGGAAAIGALLLWIATWDGQTFIATRVGSAGEWFAGVAGFLVLWWAVREPRRQREHEAVNEVRHRLAAARSVVLHQRNLLIMGGIEPDNAGDVMRLEGCVGNYGQTPVRIVRLLIDWLPPVQVVRVRSHVDDEEVVSYAKASDLVETNIFTIADALAPGAECVLNDLQLERFGHKGLYFGLVPNSRGLNGDIAHLRLMFYDVHGDEWTGWFGPQGNEAHIQLHGRPSPFWTAELRQLIPPLPNDFLPT